MKRISAHPLCFLLALMLLCSLWGGAGAEEKKTVRVGWYESSYNTTAPSGRRSGYAYEYQLKVAAYANRMYLEHPETPMDAIVLNIEQFHSVNALNGREFGDQVLRALGSEIRAVSRERGGIAGRFEADRFDLYCPHQED